MLPDMQRAITYQQFVSKININGPEEPPSRFHFKSLHLGSNGGEIPLRLQTPDGLSLEAWHITSRSNNPVAPTSKASPLFIYFHGNASSRTRLQKLLIYDHIVKTFPDSQILALDYRGFAKSDGKPDQKGRSIDARTAWDYATTKLGVNPKYIILLGQSLGSAVTTHLLKEINEGGMVPQATFLFCAFKSVPEVCVDYPKMKVAMPLVTMIPRLSSWVKPYIHDQWDAIAAVRSGLQGPILWLHGTNDKDVPYSHGKALIRAALWARNSQNDIADVHDVNGKKLRLRIWKRAQLGFIKIPNGGHDDMGNRPEIFTALRDFLAALER